MHVTQDDESAESVEAVRSVVREALDRSSDDTDATWTALAAAGLLSLPVPEAHGGEGLGLPEVAVLLREAGQRAVQLPVWETLCCGVLTLAAAGSEEQRAALLPGDAVPLESRGVDVRVTKQAGNPGPGPIEIPPPSMGPFIS